MTQRTLALILTAVKVVIALAPIAMCGECRDLGSAQLAFTQSDCPKCDRCGLTTESARSDGKGGVQAEKAKHSKVFQFGVGAANETKRDISFASDLSVGWLAIVPLCATKVADCTGLEFTPASSPGSLPATGAFALRC